MPNYTSIYRKCSIYLYYFKVLENNNFCCLSLENCILIFNHYFPGGGPLKTIGSNCSMSQNKDVVPLGDLLCTLCDCFCSTSFIFIFW